ncbi:MAG: GTP-binding protein [Comamonadaceae bacterium]|nr:GTP-binding protein [Comamonadaceae bacterium]
MRERAADVYVGDTVDRAAETGRPAGGQQVRPGRRPRTGHAAGLAGRGGAAGAAGRGGAGRGGARTGAGPAAPGRRRAARRAAAGDRDLGQRGARVRDAGGRRRAVRALAAPDSGVLRAKGFLTGLDGRRVLLQQVGARVRVEPLPVSAAAVSDWLLLIGRGDLGRLLDRLARGRPAGAG